MTIEEYDSKQGTREMIKLIDDTLPIIMNFNNSLRRYAELSATMPRLLEDKVLSERLKDLLLKRREELVEEFTK